MAESESASKINNEIPETAVQNTADGSHIYFSLMETGLNEEGYSVMDVKCIDPVTFHVEDIGTIPYYSQGPLAVYDKSKNIIYYSKRVDTEEDYGDQLFAYDVSTGNSTQLTDNTLWAINYLYPVGDSVYMLGVMNNTHYLTIIRYDCNTKELSVIDTEGKWNFYTLTYNIYNHKFYAAACLKEEEDALIQKFNSLDDDDPEKNDIPPDYTVFEFGEDIKNPIEILHTNRKEVIGIDPIDENTLYITERTHTGAMGEVYEDEYFRLDLNTGKQLKSHVLDDYRTSVVYTLPNDNKLYLLGDEIKSGYQGLYCYDPNTKTSKLLYETDIMKEEGYIENCYLLPY